MPTTHRFIERSRAQTISPLIPAVGDAPEHFQVVIEAGKKIATLTKNRAIGLGILGVVYARAQERERAIEIARQLEEGAPGEPALGYWVGLIRCALGEGEVAVERLERVEQAGLGILIILACEPCFAPLRPLPRFQALLRRLGLA